MTPAENASATAAIAPLAINLFIGPPTATVQSRQTIVAAGADAQRLRVPAPGPGGLRCCPRGRAGFSPPWRSPRPGLWPRAGKNQPVRSEEHTSELQSRLHLVCRLLLEKKKNKNT